MLRKEAPESNYKFLADLSKLEPTHVVVWTAYLDPVTHRSADITVQPLRAGLSLTIPLTNSNPAVGTNLQRSPRPSTDRAEHQR